jgi:hypothetical protein
MTIEIAGLGCALPPGWLTQPDAASAANRLRQFNDEAIAARQLQLLTALSDGALSSLRSRVAPQRLVAGR